MTWKSDDLEKFLSLLKEAKMVGNVAPATFRGAKKADKNYVRKLWKIYSFVMVLKGCFNFFSPGRKNGKRELRKMDGND